MDHCLFCRIAAGTLPSRQVFADDDLVAFHDLHPQAPVHILLIPRRHIPSVAAAEAGDGALLGRLLLVAAELARTTGIAESGFRILTNTGRHAGQSVDHLHVHLLGGRPMSWPPG